MRRRQLITLLGAAAAAWPLAARAQQAGKLSTIGFLGTATASGWSTWTTSFVARLRELGWIEGHTIAIEYRWAEGRNDRYAEIVAEFVRLKVDVIVTTGAASSLQSARHPLLQFCSRSRRTRSAVGSLQVWRDREATLPACPARRPISSARELNCFAKWFPISKNWQSWPMLATLRPCWRWIRLRQPL